MTDVIRKQILIELINLLENPRKKIQLNEFDIPFSSEDIEAGKAALDTAFSNAAEELRYLFNIAYRKQTAVGRFHTSTGKAISEMWDAAAKLTWDDINFLKNKDPAVLFGLVFDTLSLADPTGIADIISGSINLAYAASHDPGVFSISMAVMQIIFGFIQAGMFLSSGGMAAPLIVLLKSIVKAGVNGWKLLKNPQVWSKIVEIIKSYKKTVIDFFKNTKIGRKFYSPKIDEVLDNMSSVNPRDLSPPSVSPIIDDVAVNQIEQGVNNLQRFTPSAGAVATVATTNKIKDLLKTTGFAGLQLAGYRLGLGGAKLIAYQEKTKELQQKTEDYMRNVWCKDTKMNNDICSHIKVEIPSFQIKYKDIPVETIPALRDDEEGTSQYQTNIEKASDYISYYDSAREKTFMQLANNDKIYTSLVAEKNK